jgi:hypothetical protein
MTTTPAPEPAKPETTAELKSLYAGTLARRLTASASTFRDIATALERLATDVPSVGTTRCPTAGYLAERSVHEAMWGVANAKLDGIVNAANEYDRVVGGESR